MQFNFNPEARPWQPGAPVPSAWGDDRKQRSVPQQLDSTKREQRRQQQTQLPDKDAFPALGGDKQAVPDVVAQANTAQSGDASKAGAVAPIKGFSWAAIVTDKSNGDAAPAASAPAPTQPSLLTAALASSPSVEPEAACSKPSPNADVPSTSAPEDTRNGAKHSNGCQSEEQQISSISTLTANVAAGPRPSEGQGSLPSSTHAVSSHAHDASAGKPVLHLSVTGSRASKNTHGSTEDRVSKGTFRGSPVTELRLATDVNRNTVRALRAMGPSDFQAVREIGQGAFGKVYLVQSRTTRQFYAMKVLNKQRVLQKEQVSYAMCERDVLCSLTHPYLVTLRFAFQTNHRLFLVMDYIEGGHLWTHMKAGFLPEAVAKVFTAEIVLALMHLHALGIAHRDLKPENILLDSDNHCRLTDFGLAKRDMAEDTRAHTMVGTIDYMAPEIVRNEGHGREVDWWSLGVLLYEMLFARLPFAPQVPRPPRGKARKDPRLEPGTDEYKAEVKRRILSGKVVWPKGPFVAVATSGAKNLIQRLLAKSPEQRLAGEAVMQHDWFKDIDWGALERREIPSPLRSSIFAGGADKVSQSNLDMAPLEVQCPRLAGYLFECDTPKGTPPTELLSSFAGFSYNHESELATAAARGDDALAAAF
eukprot:jgi/Ulvmu1/5722/UM024_0075.1